MVQPRTDALDTVATSYTLCCEPACEARVAQDLSRLATGIDSEVGEPLRALVLTGPFARGEGGIVERDGELCAADPGYQLLALFRRRPERHARALAMMAATWSRLLRARVTIQPWAESELANVPASRFWFQAGASRSVTLVGDPALARMLPTLEPAAIRKQEAASALCEGLLELARSMLEADVPLAERIEHQQRAVLSCGDAWLLRRGGYTPGMRERAHSLQTLQAGAALRAAYLDAIAFTERADRWCPTGTNLQAWLEATPRWLATWFLDFEASYAGTPRDVLGYARDPRALLAAWGAKAEATQRRRHGLFSRGAEPAPALDRLFRSSVLLGLAPHAPACRLEAARLLGLTPQANGSAANRELARCLRALAQTALADPSGAPFATFG